MENRRNFYRILRVQPDASPEVIQQSYRALMQKLKMHPDLGGEHWDAGIVNQAYNVLRNAKKRADYDVELLQQYSIKTLAGADVMSDEHASGETLQGRAGAGINQRNFYRLLHVQPDAEIEVIRSSFRKLMDIAPSTQRSLLKRAIDVLDDPEQRALYDELIRKHPHWRCVELIKAWRDKKHTVSKNTVVANGSASDENGSLYEYHPSISQFCAFCKTPYATACAELGTVFCVECGSPLLTPQKHFFNTPRRSLARMQRSETARYFSYWPSVATEVMLDNLSPTGASFRTAEPLDSTQMLKIDASHFKAVGEIAHVALEGVDYQVGVRFSAVHFHNSSGTFLSTSA
ncbi:MAG: DnaJ domain-containing protein [Pseudomonadota bacterium]